MWEVSDIKFSLFFRSRGRILRWRGGSVGKEGGVVYFNWYFRIFFVIVSKGRL